MEFSIIIPVAPNRNTEVLESLKVVDYPSNKYEIIIEKGINPSENRDSGITKAKYENLIFLDDDAFIEKDFLNNIKNFFDKYPDVDIVGGIQLTPHSDSFFSKIAGIALSSFFGAYKMKNRYAGTKVNLNASEKDLTSAICVIKKHVFNKISDFNPKYFPGEDPDLFIRAKKNNLKLASDPNIKIYHKRRPNFSSFFKQIYSYGHARPRISNNALISVFVMPSLFIVYLVLLPLLITINKLFIFPIAIYGASSVLFAAYDSIKHKNLKAFFLLPFLYLTMHISYGLGFLNGLIKEDQ